MGEYPIRFRVGRACRMSIGSVADVVTARQRGRILAMELGFDGSDLTLDDFRVRSTVGKGTKVTMTKWLQ